MANDYLIRATAENGSVRAFAAVTTDTVETARQAHNTSPVATAALGRLMTGAVMMGADMKDDRDLLTVKIGCSGPIQGLVVTADRNGHVKGYAQNPSVMLPPNELGKLDVGGALDTGVLTVIKDIGLKEPYVGDTILVSGEIAEDLTYYYATSEQIPSSVALGVLMNKENTVRQAGGYMVQLMPGCPEEVAEKLEKKIREAGSVTGMLDKGMSPEQILAAILSGMKPDIKPGKTPVEFRCSCSREKVEQAIISLGVGEIRSMIGEGKPAELSCSFCGKKYQFDTDELRKLMKQAK